MEKPCFFCVYLTCGGRYQCSRSGGSIIGLLDPDCKFLFTSPRYPCCSSYIPVVSAVAGIPAVVRISPLFLLLLVSLLYCSSYIPVVSAVAGIPALVRISPLFLLLLVSLLYCSSYIPVVSAVTGIPAVVRISPLFLLLLVSLLL